MRDGNATRWRLTPLDAYRSTPKRLRLLPGLLLSAAVVGAVSLVLVWHHNDVPGEAPAPLYGYRVASWLGVASFLSVAFAVRFSRWGFGFLGRWLLALFTFFICLGMFIDHLNAAAQAASIYVAPFYGPGFFLGGACAVVLILATVISWRTED